MPVIVLAGEEDFGLSRRVAELKEELLEPEWASFNLSRLDNPDLRAVIDAAAALPFGPGNKVVLCERCDLFTKRKARSGDADAAASGKADKAIIDDFERALQAVAPQTYLIFACPFNFDSTLRTSKAVSKHARLEEFRKERYWVGSRSPALETWCRKEAKRFGATIEDDAIAYLLDSTEADLRQVSQELQKAAVYLLPATHITLDTVTTLSSHHSHVFSLLNHWAAGNRSDALASLEELLSRQSGMPLIAALHTTLTKWIHLKALASREEARSAGPGIQRRELPLPDLSRRLAAQLNAKPFAVEMDLKRTRRLSVDKLVSKRKQLCELEYLVKTGQMPDRHALVVFVTT